MVRENKLSGWNITLILASGQISMVVVFPPLSSRMQGSHQIACNLHAYEFNCAICILSYLPFLRRENNSTSRNSVDVQLSVKHMSAP